MEIAGLACGGSMILIRYSERWFISRLSVVVYSGLALSISPQLCLGFSYPAPSVHLSPAVSYFPCPAPSVHLPRYV